MKITACPKGFKEPGFDVENWQKAEAEHAARLKQHLIDYGHTGEYTGEIISFGVADGAAQYMIVDGPGRYGSRTFLIHLNYGDGYQYRGVEHFPKAKIIQMAKSAREYKKLFERRTDWWEEREIGEIVHYCDGHGKYVRGEIVQTDDGKAMKEVALVGDWGQHDLPRRYIDGTVHYPYHAQKVVEGDTSKPNSSNMYEYLLGKRDASSRELLARHKVDPRKLKPVSLELPPMTKEETEMARVEKLRQAVIETLKDIGSGDKVNAESITRQLRAAADKIAEAL